MAIVISTEYTHAIAPSGDYPQGSFKNVSTPAGIDGTPLEKAWPNDLYGFLQRLLEETSTTPSGVPDTVLASDYFDALDTIIKRDFLFRGDIDGLITSNNAVDPDHDIDISVGQCRDSGDAKSIFLDSAITKQIDVNWAEGTHLGGFPSGLTLAADTWYHMFVIMSADGSKIDAGFDTSLAAVNLLADATDYSVYRRIGSVLTDGSNNILSFMQINDNFYWKNPILDFGAASSLSRVLVTLSTPPGIEAMAQITLYIDTNSVYICHPGATDLAPNPTGSPGVTLYAAGANAGQISCLTDTSSRIATRYSAVAIAYLVTQGWIDPRGKDV